ncbi:MAG: BatA domain-containing protein, partial [Bacteroidota bacterium]
MIWIAFAGLLIPLALHLWNRKQGKELRFGSIQWLIPSEEKRMSRIKFTDVWLFAVRTLLVLAFVLLLMELGWWRSVERAQVNDDRKWVLVERELYSNGQVQKNVSTLLERGYSLRYFEAGFPLIVDRRHQETTEEFAKVNYWSLLKSIDFAPNGPDSVALFAIPKVQRFAGRRPTIYYHLDWWPLPYEKTTVHLAKALEKQYGATELVMGKSNENFGLWERFELESMEREAFQIDNYPSIKKLATQPGTPVQLQLDKEGTAPLVIEVPDTVNVLLCYESAFRKDLRYLQAALRVVNAVRATELVVSSAGIG